jgi:glucose-1-phosphate cytidylyltransferase
MKVVLFCGGLGTRLKEFSETIPKPMVEIGYRPLMWHLMRYYAHFGHKDFILCLGYRGDYIKKYFLNYDEWLSNDFVMKKGGQNVQLRNNDIEDWTISFIDTGLHTNIGQRLLAVKEYLDGDDVFMANYTDGLTDLDLNDYMKYFNQQNKIASFLSVKPSLSFHVVSSSEDGVVSTFEPVNNTDLRINGGFFVFKKEIFDYIEEGEELVHEPFKRLIAGNQLLAYQHKGFWASIDTLKEKKMFDDMYATGDTPWAVWDAVPRNSRYRMNSNGNGQLKKEVMLKEQQIA